MQMFHLYSSSYPLDCSLCRLCPRYAGANETWALLSKYGYHQAFFLELPPQEPNTGLWICCHFWQLLLVSLLPGFYTFVHNILQHCEYICPWVHLCPMDGQGGQEKEVSKNFSFASAVSSFQRYDPPHDPHVVQVSDSTSSDLSSLSRLLHPVTKAAAAQASRPCAIRPQVCRMSAWKVSFPAQAKQGRAVWSGSPSRLRFHHEEGWDWFRRVWGRYFQNPDFDWTFH